MGGNVKLNIFWLLSVAAIALATYAALQFAKPSIEPSFEELVYDQPSNIDAASFKRHVQTQSVTIGAQDFEEVALRKNDQSVARTIGSSLTVHAHGRTLRSVLDEVSGVTGIAYHAGEANLDEMVEIDFVSASIDDLWRSLLRDFDAIYFYEGQSAGSAVSKLASIWIYPRGTGKRMVPTPLENRMVLSDFRERLSSANPDERASATEAVIERVGQNAFEQVTQALLDSDERVRSRVLDKAVREGIVLPLELLSELLRSDRSPLVRYIALTAIARLPTNDYSGVDLIFRSALRDEDEAVRVTAQQYLASIQNEKTKHEIE